MIFKRLFSIFGIILMIYSASASGNNIAKRNELLKLLFREIDANRINKEYQTALENKDEDSMIKALAEYYRKRPDSLYLQKRIKNKSFSAAAAERAVRNEVTVVNIPWKFQDKIDWIFNPTWKNYEIDLEKLNRD